MRPRWLQLAEFNEKTRFNGTLKISRLPVGKSGSLHLLTALGRKCPGCTDFNKRKGERLELGRGYLT